MWNKKDLLGIRDLSGEEIKMILDLAKEKKEQVLHPNKRAGECSNYTMTTIFYENSTRTKMSFSQAGQYLGMQVSDLGIQTSSVNKGESLVDTGITLDQMGIDLMVMRHSMTGAPHLLAKNVKASVINAGDGTNEHPTQALLDLFTILEEKKEIEGLKVAIIGDIAHSRVARSNIYGLTKLGAKVVLAGPATLVPSMMKSLGAEIAPDIPSAIQDADVVMGLRIQQERQKGGMFPDTREYAHCFGINEEMLKLAKPDVMVMHPGPVNRGVEMTSEVVDGPHSFIHKQVQNGVAIRMAILQLLAEGRKQNENLDQAGESHRPIHQQGGDLRYLDRGREHQITRVPRAI